ncbi:MAG: F-box protein, partial [bacterium]
MKNKNILFLLLLILSIKNSQLLSQLPKPMEVEGSEEDLTKLLPQEIFEQILNKLTTEELIEKASGVSRRWREAIENPDIWNKKINAITGLNRFFPSNSMGYSLSNIDEAGKILKFLEKLKAEKEKRRDKVEKKLSYKNEELTTTGYSKQRKRKKEIKESRPRKKRLLDEKTGVKLKGKIDQLPREINSIKKAINSLLKYFHTPQTILNNLLKLENENQVKLPEDLPEGVQPAWPESQIRINWRKEWQDLDRKWEELKDQETISSADLNNQLFARLLIVAKAYLNKNNNQINIDEKEGNELFK